MSNFVLVLAGGTGVRFGANSPKQFAMINGATLLELSISAFEKCSQIDYIIVVTNSAYIEQTKELLTKAGTSKVVDIVCGGQTRFESSFQGLQAVSNFLEHDSESTQGHNVLIHDAARAFVSQEVIINVIDGLGEADGVQPIIPVTQTIVQKIQGKWVTQNRDDFATVQTPQGFKLEKILLAYHRAIDSPSSSWVPTDDISVLQEYSKHSTILAVSGDYKNKKITYPEDLTTHPVSS
jgi:2-C-methyl-D-erythritol 4-phosphate cytidylyltransferase